MDESDVYVGAKVASRTDNGRLTLRFDEKYIFMAYGEVHSIRGIRRIRREEISNYAGVNGRFNLPLSFVRRYVSRHFQKPMDESALTDFLEKMDEES